MEKEDIIIICQGGLGDHLSLSTLPECFSRLGHDVYISQYNIYRNFEINDMVWATNPYIKGVKDGPANAGHFFTPNLNGTPFIEAIEKSHGIVGSGNKFPKLYRTPDYHSHIADKIVLNLECISAVYDEETVKTKTEQILDSLGSDRSDVVSARMINEVNLNKHSFPSSNQHFKVKTDYPEYDILSLMHFTDTIFSCKAFITLHSGGASIASAVNQCNTYVIMNESLRGAYESKCFIYENQKYIF